MRSDFSEIEKAILKQFNTRKLVGSADISRLLKTDEGYVIECIKSIGLKCPGLFQYANQSYGDDRLTIILKEGASGEIQKILDSLA